MPTHISFVDDVDFVGYVDCVRIWPFYEAYGLLTYSSNLTADVLKSLGKFTSFN